MIVKTTLIFVAYFAANALIAWVSAEPVNLQFSRQMISGESSDIMLARRASAKMPIEHASYYYRVDFEVGSNNQRLAVQVDTGSSDLWIPSSNVVCVCFECYYLTKRDRIFNPGEILKRFNFFKSKKLTKRHRGLKLSPIPSPFPNSPTEVLAAKVKRASRIAKAYTTTNTCKGLGSFNTASSNSFKLNRTASIFEIGYADNSGSVGFWGRDTVRFGNIRVQDLSFAVANYTTSAIGVLGIGLMGLESTDGYQYLNLPAKLKAQGTIKKNAYSVYLNTTENGSGSVLFGGIDRSKFVGNLVTLPIVSPTGIRDRLLVALHNISTTVLGKEIAVLSRSYAAILDTGATYSHMSSSVVRGIAKTLNATWDLVEGFYSMACPSDDSGSLKFDFGGIKILGPLSNFILKDGNTCFLSIQILDDDMNFFILGDDFLRQVYVVYDLDDLEISLGRVSHGTIPDIVEISSTVPEATRTTGYYRTNVATSFRAETKQYTVTSARFTPRTSIYNIRSRLSEALLRTAARSSSSYDSLIYTSSSYDDLISSSSSSYDDLISSSSSSYNDLISSSSSSYDDLISSSSSSDFAATLDNKTGPLALLMALLMFI